LIVSNPSESPRVLRVPTPSQLVHEDLERLVSTLPWANPYYRPVEPILLNQPRRNPRVQFCPRHPVSPTDPSCGPKGSLFTPMVSAASLNQRHGLEAHATH
jgi:hypothetical protein